MAKGCQCLSHEGHCNLEHKVPRLCSASAGNAQQARMNDGICISTSAMPFLRPHNVLAAFEGDAERAEEDGAGCVDKEAFLVGEGDADRLSATLVKEPKSSPHSNTSLCQRVKNER